MAEKEQSSNNVTESDSSLKELTIASNPSLTELPEKVLLGSPISNPIEEPWLQDLPRAVWWENSVIISKWKGYWFETCQIDYVTNLQSSLKAQNSDVILASTVKTGTTWLKALCLYITQTQSMEEDILTKGNPHSYVPTIETAIFAKKSNEIFDVHTMTSPRLYHTHLAFSLLPKSIQDSSCKIIYISRNPKDTFVSMWHFYNSVFQKNHPIERAFESFCSGVQMYGPFFEHVLEYWEESKKRPKKVLFLRYEEIQKNPKGEVKKIASFLGKDFKSEEEVEELLWKCSLERLKNLEVNKDGGYCLSIPKSSYFRKGKVGDWKNYLTPEMSQNIDEITNIKLKGSGLEFEYL